MNRSAVLHIPLSQYAFAESESRLTIRLRTARNDLRKCTLFYADRCCRKSPIEFEGIPMTVRFSDELHDYYEVTFDSPYNRVCYYFKLEDDKEWTYYYADQFRKELADLIIDDKIIEGRSEYYQYPIILRSELNYVPDWFKNAVVYNIFPDSFADSYRSIPEQGITIEIDNGRISSSHNGGTIQGISDNLDYIADMGFNCIYLNPVFVAGEWHKYDTINYFQIDPCFGNNVDFKRLVDDIHQRGMHIIIDGVFNHCSWYSDAFNDLVEKGSQSEYADWFYDYELPVRRPNNDTDYPEYTCFAYEKKMPKLNTANPKVQDYFAKVCRYWMTEYNVDGWRLDVANEIDKNFWRKFRHTVTSVNKDAVLIGEVWENSEVWLRGDMFNSTMNYDFRKHVRDFLCLNRFNATQFASEINKMIMRYPRSVAFSQLNLIDSHDVPRFFSLCQNNVDKYMQALVLLFIMPGIPSLFYGDELKLQGITESEYRQPMKWQDINNGLGDFIKKLIEIRKEYINPDSDLEIKGGPDQGLLYFKRSKEGITVNVVINSGDSDIHFNDIIMDRSIIQSKTENNCIGPGGFCIYI